MYEANAPKNSRQNSVFYRQRHLLRGSVARTALLGAVPLIALSFTGEARAQTVTWTAPSGTNASWFTAADWTDNTATHRLPAATDSPTLIQTPGIVTIGAGGTATAGGLQVLGGGELDVVAGGTLSTALNSTIGIAPASVTGGISTATSGTGTMVVSGTGSTWNASNVGVRVGFGSGAVGTLSIGTGAGTGGLLNMTGGLLTVGSTSGTGTLNINGGSVADPTAAIREGFNGGTGTINITNGGTLTTAALNTIGSNSEAAGVPAGGTGAVTIAGTGSSWVIGVGGNLAVGSGTGASGSITVSAGGTFSNQGNAFIGYTGGTTGAGGTGSVTVTGAGSVWTVGANNTGALALGYGTGSSGTVLVSAGGTLNTSTNFTQATLIGYNDGVTTGGTGKLTVDGAGSTWNSGSDIVVAGGTAPGTTTVGTLTVSNGGKINNVGNSIYVAQISGATGTLNILSGGTVTAVNVSIGDGGALGTGTIDGAGSSLTASGNLVVGFSSSGANSLTISNGGVASFGGVGQVGQGGTGTVTVTGQGSGFTIGNNFTLGEQAGTGTLNIANNAIVTQTAGETLAGFGGLGGAGTTGAGTVNITTGGAFRGTTLVLGYNAGATGNLNMGSGGQASLTGLEVGWNGGTGTASIAGQGTSLNATGAVTVGHDAGNGGSTTGTLTVAERQVRNSSNRLAANLEAAIGLRSVLASEAKLWRAGDPVDVSRGRQLAGVISLVCDDLYTKAPIVMNELLNRNALSTAAAAARMRLIEGIFLFADRRMLGIDEDRAPPEKSMYLSVLSTGHIHREEKGRFFIDEPPDDRDPLRLRPAISKIMNVLESAKGGRIGVDRLFAELRAQPFGVRDGVSPLLLAIVLSTRSHEIAVYENGTFLHKFGPSDFLRLTKQPEAFECQLCRVVGVRAEVFRRLLDCFSASKPQSRNSDLLDVVGPLCTFAAQLPDFTRRSSQIDGVAIKVRDCLLTGQDPSRLIFHQLPEACGIKPFDPDGKRDTKEIEAFVSTLRSATDTLRDTYPALLVAIASDVGRHLSAGEGNFDRAKLAYRAARVSLAVRETRIRTFSLRLRDPGLTPDAWIESLASVVVSKPPAKWTAADLSTWQTDIALLGETFLRVEATAFASGPEPAKTAVRIGITLADGREVARVIETTPEEEERMGRAISKINSVLEGSRADRLAILYRLLWESLGGTDPEAHEPSESKNELQG